MQQFDSQRAISPFWASCFDICNHER